MSLKPQCVYITDMVLLKLLRVLDQTESVSVVMRFHELSKQYRQNFTNLQSTLVYERLHLSIRSDLSCSLMLAHKHLNQLF